ncbi:MAG: hypothetical protein JJE47_12290 [Acidimicrobiia bacterium]|nr:hypothetical protein [Acidimicrobiia bacterium]
MLRRARRSLDRQPIAHAKRQVHGAVEIASMDDEAKFGPVFHSLSFGEAIGRELLSDYQVAIIGVDDPTYRKLVEQGVFVTGDGVEVTDARTLAAHIGLAKAMRDFGLHRTISFHLTGNGSWSLSTPRDSTGPGVIFTGCDQMDPKSSS